MKKKLILLFLILTSKISHATKAFEKYGDIMQFALPISSLMYVENKKDFLFTYTKVLVATHAIKFIANNTSLGNRPRKKRSHSFPSGHTASAFVGAFYIHKYFSLKEAALPYLLASSVGISRIYSKQHHVRDVIGSIVISGLGVFLSKEIE